MHRFWVLVGQTYKGKIKSKAFIWSTILTIIVMFAGVTLPEIMTNLNDEESLNSLAIVNAPSNIEETLAKSMEDVSVKTVQTTDEAEDLLVKEEINAYLEAGDSKNLLVSNQPIKQEDLQSVVQSLQVNKTETMSSQLNVSGAELQELLIPIPFESKVIEDSQKSLSDKERNAAENIAIGLLFLLYMFVLLYGTMIAMEIAKEKGSRIMEVIISSSSATAHFFGKLVGVFLISLTQLSVFGIIGSLVVMNFGSDMIKSVVRDTLQSVPLSVWIYALILGLLGYLLYGVLAAFVGSLVSKVEDINNFMAPISYLLMIALLGAMVGISSPSSLLITIGSYIPFFTPMLMFIRISLLEVSTIEIVTSLSILVGSIALLMALCVRFYQGSVLLYSNHSLFKSIKSAWKLAGEK